MLGQLTRSLDRALCSYLMQMPLVTYLGTGGADNAGGFPVDRGSLDSAHLNARNTYIYIQRDKDVNKKMNT